MKSAAPLIHVATAVCKCRLLYSSVIFAISLLCSASILVRPRDTLPATGIDRCIRCTPKIFDVAIELSSKSLVVEPKPLSSIRSSIGTFPSHAGLGLGERFEQLVGLWSQVPFAYERGGVGSLEKAEVVPLNVL